MLSEKQRSLYIPVGEGRLYTYPAMTPDIQDLCYGVPKSFFLLIFTLLGWLLVSDSETWNRLSKDGWEYCIDAYY